MMRIPLTVGAVAIAIMAALITASPADAQGWSSDGPDGYAPIGVPGDHLQAEGGFTLTYRFSWMEREGNRDGTDQLRINDVYARGYLVVPLSMRRQTHAVEASMGVTDGVTLRVTVPFVRADMDQQSSLVDPRALVEEFTTESSGVGDIEASALVQLMNAERRSAHLHLGLGLPTGSIGQMDRTPESESEAEVLPYPMQTGSGTLDLLPGVTWLGRADTWSWGLQGTGVIRLGKNDRDYRLGHRGDATGWLAWTAREGLSVSGRLRGELRGDVAGADPELDPFITPTADPRFQSGSRIDAGVGLTFRFGQGAFHGQRLALEVQAPLYQNLDGPQLETDWSLIAGWTYSSGG